MNNRIRYIKINNINNLLSNLKQGDYIFIDFDKTLVLTGIEKYNSEVMVTEKEIIKQIKIVKESHIPVIGLTARDKKYAEKTKEQLASLDIECDDIIHAPDDLNMNAKKIYCKGKELKKYLKKIPEMPKRVIMIDDNKKQLESIKKSFKKSNQSILLCYYRRKIHHTINSAQSSITFPKNLKHFTKVTSLAGGTKSTYKITNPNTKQDLVIKYGADLEAIQLEILCNAIYRILDVPVPSMHLYKTIPRNLAKQIGIKTIHGSFQVAEFVEAKSSLKVCRKIARKHFIAHVLLGNIDVAKEDNFIGNILVDAGANFIRRALGNKRQENASLLNELSSLRNIDINPSAYEWFSSLSKDELIKQAKEILDKSEEIEKAIWKVSKLVGMPDTLRNQFFQHMADRLDKLEVLYAIDERPKARKYKKAIPGATAAGILIYRYSHGEVFIQLSKRRGHDWLANFGGGSNKKDGLIADTAVREVSEESSQQFLYQPSELEQSPSHDLITIKKDGSPFTYRMYMLQENGGHLSKITDAEHTEHYYVSLEKVLNALNENNIILCEGEETIEINSFINFILYPPLYRMLQQSAVKENLQRLVSGEQLKKTHTQGLSTQPFIQPINCKTYLFQPAAAYQADIIKSMQVHAKMVQELKKRHKQINHSLTVPAESLTQSELYLKAFMGDDYHHNQLEQNIKIFFEKYAPLNNVSYEKKEILIQQCIKLINIEKSTGDKYFYFYHGCNNEVTFAYAVYTTLYEALRLSDAWPVFRAIREPFQKYNDIHQFINYYSGGGQKKINNNTEGYKDCAISANIFLFGNHQTSTSYTLEYFINNTVMTNIDLMSVFKNLFQPFSVSSHAINQLINVYNKYVTQQKGSLFQIRIPKEVVTQYAYPAGKLGRMKKLEDEQDLTIIVEHLKKRIEAKNKETLQYMNRLQARLFLPPDKHFETNHIMWEEAHYQSKIQQAIDPIIHAILAHTSYEPDTLDQNLPLFRLVRNACESRNVAIGNLMNEKTLIAAILTDNKDKIISIFTAYPEMKYKKLKTPKEIKSRYFSEHISPCTLMHDHANLSIEFLMKCYGEEWWHSYDSKEINHQINVLIKLDKPNRSKLLNHLSQQNYHISNMDLAYLIPKIAILEQAEKTAIINWLLLNTNHTFILKALVENNKDNNKYDLIDYLLEKIQFLSGELEETFFSAILAQDIRLLKSLLNAGFDPNSRLKTIFFLHKDSTPLLIAVRKEKLQVVNFLLEIKAIDPNLYDEDQETALSLAIEANNAQMVAILLDIPNLNPNIPRISNKKTPLHTAIESANRSIVFKLIHRKDIDLKATDIRGETPLISAIWRDDIEIFKALLAKYSVKDINQLNTNTNKTPLYCAVKHGNPAIVQTLLDVEGIDLKNCLEPQQDASPLLLAILEGKKTIMTMILRKLKPLILESEDNCCRGIDIARDAVLDIFNDDELTAIFNWPKVKEKVKYYRIYLQWKNELQGKILIEKIAFALKEYLNVDLDLVSYGYTWHQIAFSNQNQDTINNFKNKLVRKGIQISYQSNSNKLELWDSLEDILKMLSGEKTNSLLKKEKEASQLIKEFIKDGLCSFNGNLAKGYTLDFASSDAIFIVRRYAEKLAEQIKLKVTVIEPKKQESFFDAGVQIRFEDGLDDIIEKFYDYKRLMVPMRYWML